LRTILGLIVVVLFAYLGSALFRLRQLPTMLQALISSGLGFFGLGLVLGPHVIALIDAPILSQLDLVLNLGVGWVGLLFGLQFNRQDLEQVRARHYWGALTETALTCLLTGAGLGLMIWFMPMLSPAWILVPALALIASTTSPTTGAQMQIKLAVRGPVHDLLRFLSGVDAVPAIVFLGALICFAPGHPAKFGPALDGLYWLGVCLALGLVLGALAHLLTLYHYTDNQLLVIVLSLVLFGGGAAHYLWLSPLFVNFIVGLVLANRSPIRIRILRSLILVEKPIYLILLTLAGAMWNPPPLAWLVLVPAFILMRMAGKILGGWLAFRIADLGTQSGLSLGSGLLPHGGMALVLGLSFQQIYSGPLGDLVVSTAIFSILVATLIGPWSLQRLLIREGEAS